jgi:hypothetical protein
VALSGENTTLDEFTFGWHHPIVSGVSQPDLRYTNEMVKKTENKRANVAINGQDNTAFLWCTYLSVYRFSSLCWNTSKYVLKSPLHISFKNQKPNTCRN